jgi:hypothetical protein
LHFGAALGPDLRELVNSLDAFRRGRSAPKLRANSQTARTMATLF